MYIELDLDDLEERLEELEERVESLEIERDQRIDYEREMLERDE